MGLVEDQSTKHIHTALLIPDGYVEEHELSVDSLVSPLKENQREREREVEKNVLGFLCLQVFTEPDRMAFLLMFVTLLHLITLAMLFIATMEKVQSFLIIPVLFLVLNFIHIHTHTVQCNNHKLLHYIAVLVDVG